MGWKRWPSGKAIYLRCPGTTRAGLSTAAGTGRRGGAGVLSSGRGCGAASGHGEAAIRGTRGQWARQGGPRYAGAVGQAGLSRVQAKSGAWQGGCVGRQAEKPRLEERVCKPEATRGPRQALIPRPWFKCHPPVKLDGSGSAALSASFLSAPSAALLPSAAGWSVSMAAAPPAAAPLPPPSPPAAAASFAFFAARALARTVVESTAVGSCKQKRVAGRWARDGLGLEGARRRWRSSCWQGGAAISLPAALGHAPSGSPWPAVNQALPAFSSPSLKPVPASDSPPSSRSLPGPPLPSLPGAPPTLALSFLSSTFTGGG